MPLAESSHNAYPRVVRLTHGKDFKIGLGFAQLDANVVISTVHEGYPAAKSNAVFLGDVLESVNGEEIHTANEAVQAIKCKGGRGTDEVVELVITGNQAFRMNLSGDASDRQKRQPDPRRAEELQATSTYPRKVLLYHGKGFKIGLDFVQLPDEEVAVLSVQDGYPAQKSEAIFRGDVIQRINGTSMSTVEEVTEALKCKGGRGTDEVIELTISCNEVDKLGNPAATPRSRPSSSRPSTASLVRSLSWSSRRKKSTATQKRDLWD